MSNLSLNLPSSRSNNSRSYPRLDVFERLYIQDGLLINAERWQQSHHYHRQRQNFQYQCLYQPGIVYGLGVTIVPDQPNGRLLRIQPGVAIDIEGNPIVVKEPVDFWLQSSSEAAETLLVHLVLNYLDPDRRRNVSQAERMQESFELIEKTQLAPQDIELCRIQLTAAGRCIQIPENIFLPTFNQLDFRHRQYPQPQPQFHVQVGQILGNPTVDSTILNGWTDLIASVPALYPNLLGNPVVCSYDAKTITQVTQFDCQLLHLDYATALSLSELALQRLQNHISQGATVLITIDFSDANLLEMLDLYQELKLANRDATRDRNLATSIREQLQGEFTAYEADITQRIASLETPLTSKFLLPPGILNGIASDHPLRRQPFLFSQLPCQDRHPVYVQAWDGIVWMLGDLSQMWGLGGTLDCPREVLRSAQEFGINLLHFAAQRWQWTQAMQLPVMSPENTDSLRERVNVS
jgi:hypothetical protein